MYRRRLGAAVTPSAKRALLPFVSLEAAVSPVMRYVT